MKRNETESEFVDKKPANSKIKIKHSTTATSSEQKSTINQENQTSHHNTNRKETKQNQKMEKKKLTDAQAEPVTVVGAG